MGKNLERQLRRENSFRSRKFKNSIKQPFECPRCSNKNCFTIETEREKFSPTVDFFASCSKCNLEESYTLPQIFKEVDVHSKLYHKFHVKKKTYLF
jgi:transcription elongation factor Elf1